LIEFSEKDGYLIFTVRVVPRSSKSEIVGEYNGTLKIKIAAPPVDNAANAELINVLCKFFQVSRSSAEIINGAHSKTKQVRVMNVNSEKLQQI
jgi:uncharacterized protein (TIGR00251 family)